MVAEGVQGRVDCSESHRPPHCLHFLMYGGCLTCGPWETRVNNGSAEIGGRGRTLWEGCPLRGGFVTWSREGSQAMVRGRRGEYKAHELTTITGCVMMGMGGEREQRARKPNLNELHML